MTSYRRAVTPLNTNPDVYRHRHPSSENARSPLRRSPGSSTVQCTTSMIPAVPLNVAPTARSSFFLAHACHSTATIERNQPLLPHTPASLILSSHALTNPPNLLSKPMCIAPRPQLRSVAPVSREAQSTRDLTTEATRPSQPLARDSACSGIVSYCIFRPRYTCRSPSLHPLIRIGSHAALYNRLSSHPSARVRTAPLNHLSDTSRDLCHPRYSSQCAPNSSLITEPLCCFLPPARPSYYRYSKSLTLASWCNRAHQTNAFCYRTRLCLALFLCLYRPHLCHQYSAAPLFQRSSFRRPVDLKASSEFTYGERVAGKKDMEGV